MFTVCAGGGVGRGVEPVWGSESKCGKQLIFPSCGFWDPAQATGYLYTLSHSTSPKFSNCFVYKFTEEGEEVVFFYVSSIGIELQRHPFRHIEKLSCQPLAKA